MPKSSNRKQKVMKNKLSSKSSPKASYDVSMKTPTERHLTSKKIFLPIIVLIIAIIFNRYPTIFIGAKSKNFEMTQKEKIDSFLSWFVTMGGSISSSVTLHSFPDYGGFGLKAIETISCSDDEIQNGMNEKTTQKGKNCSYGGIEYMQELFTVPNKIITSTDTVMTKYNMLLTKVERKSNNSMKKVNFQKHLQQILDHRFSQHHNMITQDIIIALELMVQCSLNKYSHMHPYLDILPKQINRLDMFHPDDLNLLQDELLAALGKESKHNIKQIWFEDGLQQLWHQMFHHTVTNKNSKLTINDIDQKRKQECSQFESFHKFVGIVSSRAMVINGKKFLTPMADMINYGPPIHDSSIQAFTKYHQQRDDGSIVVRADRRVNPDDQILENYGNVDNSLFLEAHGFVPYYNPFHCAILSSHTFPAFHTLSESTKKILIQLKIIKETDMVALDVCVDAGGKIQDKKAFAYSAILGINDDPQLLSKCMQSSTNGDTESITMHCFRYEGHQKRILKIIQNAAKLSLEKKETSLQDDLILLQKYQTDGIEMKSLALKFRIEEKKLLHKITEIMVDKGNKFDSTVHSIGNTTNYSTLSSRVDDFNLFLQQINFPINHIKAKVVDNGMRLGAIATKDLNLGDTYLSIPIEWTISIDTIDNSALWIPIKHLLPTYNHAQSQNAFTLLILYVIHERYVLQEESKWWPYLYLLPTFDDMTENLPLFFDEDKLDMLLGSDLRPLIIKYQRNVEEKFVELFSNAAIGDLLGSAFTYNNFRWAHAIWDTRSIWWEGKRHLVPLLDLVNCDTGTRTLDKVHSTSLEEYGKFAVTQASRAFRQGEQIFENYGQPNHIYFLYHGFILNENNHDCALINNLNVNKLDKGAKDIPRMKARLSEIGIQTFNPSFCVRDFNSLDNIADFLRIKHDMPDRDQLGIDFDIKYNLKYVIEEKLNMYLREPFDDNSAQNLSSTEMYMMQQLQNEKNIFEKCLQELINNY